MQPTFDAIEYPVGSGIYVSAGKGSGYGGVFLASASFPASVSLNQQSRRNAPGLLKSISLDGRTIPFSLVRETSLDQATFQGNVAKWFDPAKSRAGVRYLRVIAWDGATQLRIPVIIQACSPRSGARDVYDVTAVAVGTPWFEAVSQSSAAGFTGAGSASNAGSGRAYPALTLAAGNVSATGLQYTITDTTGRGLIDFPIALPKLEAGGTRTFDTSCFVIANEVSVPCWGQSSATYAVCLVSVPANGSTTVEVVSFTGVAGAPVNPLATVLSSTTWTDEGIKASTLTATNVDWPTCAVSANPERQLVWRPLAVTFSTSLPGSWGYSYSESGTAAAMTLNNPNAGNANDANALYLDVGGAAGTLNALTGLSRNLAGTSATGVRIYVRYRTAGQTLWTVAWSASTLTTVTTAIDLDNAIEIIAGIEYTSASGADGAQLNLSPASTVVSLAYTGLTISTGTAVTYQLLNGTIQNTTTGQTITFANVISPSGSLTIDCAADPNTREIVFPSGGTTLGTPSFSDSVDWFSLDPGANTLNNGLSASLSLSWRDVYG